MVAITVRLPAWLIAAIDEESCDLGWTKSAVVAEWLSRATAHTSGGAQAEKD